MTYAKAAVKTLQLAVNALDEGGGAWLAGRPRGMPVLGPWGWRQLGMCRGVIRLKRRAEVGTSGHLQPSLRAVRTMHSQSISRALHVPSNSGIEKVDVEADGGGKVVVARADCVVRRKVFQLNV